MALAALRLTYPTDIREKVLAQAAATNKLLQDMADIQNRTQILLQDMGSTLNQIVRDVMDLKLGIKAMKVDLEVKGEDKRRILMPIQDALLAVRKM
jgi:hypothetical protein